MTEELQDAIAGFRRDPDAILDDLLERWHVWKAAYRATRSWAGANATCRDATSGMLYDRETGALDAGIEKTIMQGFDEIVDSVPQPWNTALQMQARNLATGYEVWHSPRLPASREEREVLLLEARNKLMTALAKAGRLC